jgi:hypothetical protein
MNDNTCLSLLSFTSVQRKAKSDRCTILRPQSILWEKLDDFMLVRDEEIMQTNALFCRWKVYALA